MTAGTPSWPTPQELVAFLVPLLRELSGLEGPFRPVPESHTFARQLPVLLAQLRCAGDEEGVALCERTMKRAQVEEQSRALPTGVVHADVHPENLLRDESGRLWLIDFDDAHVGVRAVDWVLAALEFAGAGRGTLDEATYESLLVALAVDATQEERAALPGLRSLVLLKFAVHQAELGILPGDNPYLRLLARGAEGGC